MPRFHFHLTHGTDVPDDAGCELADIDDARCHAVKMIADDLCESPHTFWDADCYRVSCTTETGLLLFTVEMFALAAPALTRWGPVRRPA